ncbi:carcinoembryonic antigen-related cell adhesion molecule 20 [Echinops telfairi]|uniref:Carcinoembryonic antigen-related cell adhesion molecule 20 n=1 Tax=Echinops telfairi TaxID=9371 RepID=A0ABM1VKM6_ECHTE|nr:carcinoembryonic antigen-related cell adhesion molecule 20 [Echinops telfairi]
MGSPGFQGPHWVGVLLSASLLTVWSPPATAQLGVHGSTPTTHRNFRNKPIISINQNSAIEHREKVEINCITSDAQVTIRWIFESVSLVPHERMLLSSDNKMLTILTVHRQDAGNYQCETWSPLLVQRSDPIRLDVSYGPDSVEIELDSGVHSGEAIEVLEGSTVVLQAKTQSSPEPEYSWLLPNSFTLTPSNSTLTIHNILREKEGRYRCLVFNKVTQLSSLRAVKIQVLDILTKPHILSPSANLVEHASSVNLTCQTTHERAAVQWFLNGQPLLPSERLELSPDNNTLVIYGLRRTDTGPYECEVWHWGSRARSDPLQLTINYGPDQVNITRNGHHQEVVQETLNSTLILQCQAESKPGAQYLWTLEGSTWMSNGEQLRINALTWDNQGLYKCTASNQVTQLALSASVLVQVIGPQASLSIGVIVGIVIGILAVLALAAGLGYFLFRKFRWSSREKASNSIQEEDHPEEHISSK